jgi:hypothetical protein
MVFWPRVVCGSTAVPLSSPCLRLPKPSSHRQLVARRPSLFLRLTWGGDFLCQLEGSKFCLFSVVLPARCVSSVSPRFHCRRLAFCFLPLAAILESFGTWCSVEQVYHHVFSYSLCCEWAFQLLPSICYHEKFYCENSYVGFLLHKTFSLVYVLGGDFCWVTGYVNVNLIIYWLLSKLLYQFILWSNV